MASIQPKSGRTQFFSRSVALSVLIGLIIDCSGDPAALPTVRRMADGNRWTTVNLSAKTVGSYCYDDSEANCRRYGRLYNWASAPLACASLGREWRLPTEDEWRLPTEDEWRQLARHYGGVNDDSEDRGKAAYRALLSGGDAKFNAVLGGGRAGDGQYTRLEAHGFYWTASENDAGGWYYNFGRGSLGFYRQSGGEKDRAFSVRCVRK